MPEHNTETEEYNLPLNCHKSPFAAVLGIGFYSLLLMPIAECGIGISVLYRALSAPEKTLKQVHSEPPREPNYIATTFPARDYKP